MDYDAIVTQALALLQREQRLAYRVLKLRLQIDDDLLEALKDDLIYAKKLAVDEEGRVLVWTGGTDVCTGRARLSVRSFPIPPQQLGRPAEVANGIIYLPQGIGYFHLQGAVVELDRKRERLLTRRHGAVGVSRDPEDIGHHSQHPSQPGSIVERPGEDLGLAQQGEVPPILSQ